jgi:hypothetical protein
MARGIFISFQHKNRNQAKGFNLLHHNTSVDISFRGRHLLDPIKSDNKSYIWQEIKKQMEGTSVTVVLLGERTHKSAWVKREIEESVARGNGVVAIQLKDQNCPLPAKSCVAKALEAAGAEIVPWSPHEFAEAIERAALAAGRAASIRHSLATASAAGSGGGCAR